MFDKRRPAPTKRVDVSSLVVGRAILPTAKQNPNPLVGQRAECGVMIVAAAALLIVVRARPPRKPNRLIGEFVKGLLHEFRAGQPMMDPARLPAPFGDGPDARVGLELAAESQRDRSVPKAAARRGAQTSPAPGTLANTS